MSYPLPSSSPSPRITPVSTKESAEVRTDEVTPPAVRRETSHRPLAALLLAAMVSALVVVADSVVDTFVDGHLLVGWMVLWTIGFALLALFADSARRTAVAVSSVFRVWRQWRARQRASAWLAARAQQDPRLLADLTAAVARGRFLGEHSPNNSLRGAMATACASTSTGEWALRRMRRQADATQWLKAQHDPRVAADVQAAIARSDASQQAAARAWMARQPVGTFNAGYQGPRTRLRASPMTGLPAHLRYQRC